jgi:hypothetical protein
MTIFCALMRLGNYRRFTLSSISSTTLVMKAHVQIHVGMRVQYDCPVGGDDYRSDEFFNKHRGKKGTIMGFKKRFVGPLMSQLPGVYADPRALSIRFDGSDEVYPSLKVDHFVLISPTEAHRPVAYEESFEPIFFGAYPGDTVLDLLENVERNVYSISFDTESGVARYSLEPTESEEAERKSKQAAMLKESRESGEIMCFGYMAYSSPRPLYRTEAEIQVLKKSIVHKFYTQPTTFLSGNHFESTEDEALFWTRSGIAEACATQYREIIGGYPVYDCSLKDAHALLDVGTAHIVLKVDDEPMPTYQAFRVYEHFSQFIPHVRALGMQTRDAPVLRQRREYQRPSQPRYVTM